MRGNVNLSGAVDLSRVRADGEQHLFVMAYMFECDKMQMSRLIETHFNGGQYILTNRPEQLIGRDGPGCAKCLGHWLDVWSTKCTVTDAEYAQRGSPVPTEPFVREAGGEEEAEFGIVGEDGTVTKPVPPMS